MQAHELLKELARAAGELSAMNQIGRTLTSTLELREVLQLIMAKVAELVAPGEWQLLLVEEGDRELRRELCVGERAAHPPELRVAMGEGLAGWVAREGQPVLLEEAAHDPRLTPHLDVPSGESPASVIAVPLRSKGRVLGVIELIQPAGKRPFTPHDLQTLSTLADYAAIAIENAKSFERIRELTRVDDHTGLFNARHLYQTLEAEVARARRFGRSFSLIFFDLDRFKAVNDRHGHQAGSAVLKEVGHVLRAAIRAMDVPIRYGGDEFIVLLPEAGRADAVHVAERLRAAVRGTAFLRDRGLDVRITASFGVATFPDDGGTAEDLLRVADGAMYRVKETSRDGIASAG